MNTDVLTTDSGNEELHIDLQRIVDALDRAKVPERARFVTEKAEAEIDFVHRAPFAHEVSPSKRRL